MAPDSSLLRPWIMKNIIDAKGISTRNPPAENYLGITFRRHEIGGLLNEESLCMWFSDGEVTIKTDFSEANAAVTCSLPSSYDPNGSCVPPSHAIIRLVSFRTEFMELVERPILNGQTINYTVNFVVEEFSILQPNWTMPRGNLHLCAFCPGVQQKASAFLREQRVKLDARISSSAPTNRVSLASAVASPSGSSVTSSILRIVAKTMNSEDDVVLTQQMVLSQGSQQDAVVSECYTRRRKKVFVERCEIECQTDMPVEEDRPESSLIQMEPSYPETQPQPQVVVTTNSAARFTDDVRFVSQSSDVVSLPDLSSKQNSAFKNLARLSSSFRAPKSPSIFASLAKSKSSVSHRNFTPKTAHTPRQQQIESPSADSPQSVRRSMSLVGAFSAGRRGKPPKNCKPKPCSVRLERCDSLLTDEILERAGLDPKRNGGPQVIYSVKRKSKRSQKSVKRKAAAESAEECSLGHTAKRTQTAEKMPRFVGIPQACVVAEIGMTFEDDSQQPQVVECYNGSQSYSVPGGLGRVAEEFLSTLAPSRPVLRENSNEIVIVEPMITASQLGLVEPENVDEMTEENYTQPKKPVDSLWFEKLSFLSEKKFYSSWGAFGVR